MGDGSTYIINNDQEMNSKYGTEIRWKIIECIITSKCLVNTNSIPVHVHHYVVCNIF